MLETSQLIIWCGSSFLAGLGLGLKVAKDNNKETIESLMMCSKPDKEYPKTYAYFSIFYKDNKRVRAHCKYLRDDNICIVDNVKCHNMKFKR